MGTEDRSPSRRQGADLPGRREALNGRGKGAVTPDGSVIIGVFGALASREW